MKVRTDDGTEAEGGPCDIAEGGPGDIAGIPPGHNPCVVGDEPCVMIIS
jgi:hypothetical protein